MGLGTGIDRHPVAVPQGPGPARKPLVTPRQGPFVFRRGCSRRGGTRTAGCWTGGWGPGTLWVVPPADCPQLRSAMSEVTRILSALEQGDPSAAGQLLPLVYDELRKLAAVQ